MKGKLSAILAAILAITLLCAACDFSALPENAASGDPNNSTPIQSAASQESVSSSAGSDEGNQIPDDGSLLPGEDVVLPEEDEVLPEEDVVLPEEDEVLPEEDEVLPEEDEVSSAGTPSQSATSSKPTVSSKPATTTSSTASSKPSADTTSSKPTVSSTSSQSTASKEPEKPVTPFPGRDTPAPYGRAQLSSKEQKVYDIILKGAKEYSSVKEDQNGKMFCEISLSDVSVDVDDIKEIILAVRADHPEVCSLANQYGWSTRNDVVTVVRLYVTATPSQRDTRNAKLEKKVKEIISSLPNTTDEYLLLKGVHDWLCKNITYTIEGENVATAYGAIVEGKALCEGYTKAFQYLAYRCGIQALIATGEGTNSSGRTESHAWNLVRCNGKWYQVDVTWDDPRIGSMTEADKPLFYDYFLIPTKQIKIDHAFEDEQAYDLPSCTATTDNYFVREKLAFTSLTADKEKIAKAISHMEPGDYCSVQISQKLPSSSDDLKAQVKAIGISAKFRSWTYFSNTRSNTITIIRKK
ncbi:MAG: hypothetical protein IJY82_04520 [Oscillospiraceae bacterium]|nr:hypothetical protein [Oscillospiraceae bacterium]